MHFLLLEMLFTDDCVRSYHHEKQTSKRDILLLFQSKDSGHQDMYLSIQFEEKIMRLIFLEFFNYLFQTYYVYLFIFFKKKEISVYKFHIFFFSFFI